MREETWNVMVRHHQAVTTKVTDLQTMQDTDLQNIQDRDLQTMQDTDLQNIQDRDLQTMQDTDLLNMEDADIQINMEDAHLQALIGATRTDLGLRPLDGPMNRLAAEISSNLPLQVIKLTPIDRLPIVKFV